MLFWWNYVYIGVIWFVDKIKGKGFWLNMNFLSNFEDGFEFDFFFINVFLSVMFWVFIDIIDGL